MTEKISPYSSWYSGCVPFTDKFIPTSDTLLFGLCFSAQADPNGFICAFFSPNIAVDSMGHVLKVPIARFEPIAKLALESVELPDTGSFRNTWRIKHDRTGREIQTLVVKIKGDDNFKVVSIYGYEKGRVILQEEVAGHSTLPEVLTELFGSLGEAREGYKKGEEDILLIKAVTALFPKY